MVAAKKDYDDVNTISTAIVKVAALISLVIIVYIDSTNQTLDAKDIELLLAGFVAGAEALTVYRKTKK